MSFASLQAETDFENCDIAFLKDMYSRYKSFPPEQSDGVFEYIKVMYGKLKSLPDEEFIGAVEIFNAAYDRSHDAFDFYMPDYLNLPEDLADGLANCEADIIRNYYNAAVTYRRDDIRKAVFRELIMHYKWLKSLPVEEYKRMVEEWNTGVENDHYPGMRIYERIFDNIGFVEPNGEGYIEL